MEIQDKYINPFTDFGFKKLFGSEFNKELLMDFLNNVLSGRERIVELTYMNVKKQGVTEADRKAVFDLYCKNENDEVFIIEVQNVFQQYFKDRSLYYATFPIQEQARRGKDWDYQLQAVYTIAILNFSFEEKADSRFRREVQLTDTETHEIFYDKFSFIYLEVPNFNRDVDELQTSFDKWMYVLKHLPRLQERPRELQEKIFQRFFEQAEIAKLNPQDMNAYEQSLKVLRDNYSIQKTATEQGKKEGLKLGIEEGRKEGRKKEKITIARRLKASGLAISIIADSTGLTPEEIERL